MTTLGRRATSIRACGKCLNSSKWVGGGGVAAAAACGVCVCVCVHNSSSSSSSSSSNNSLWALQLVACTPGAGGGRPMTTLGRRATSIRACGES